MKWYIVINELYYTQKNKGAYTIPFHPFKGGDRGVVKEVNNMWSESSQKLQVSKKGIKDGTILVSRNYLREYEQKIVKKYNMKQIPAGSAGLKICWIAKGIAELYINSSNKSGLWDTCAADIILKEADGNICDLNNNEIVYNNQDVMLQKGYIISNINFENN